MIKLTLRELDAANRTGAFRAFIAAKKPIAAKVANRKLPAAFDDEVAKLDQSRRELAIEYGGVPNKATQIFEFSPENQARMAAAMATLMDQVIELPGEAVKLDDITDCEANEAQIGALDPFIIFPQG